MVKRVIRAVWAYLGLLGLTLRKLLTRVFWRPIVWAGRPIIVSFQAIWTFLGRLGLAWRKVLTWSIWKPLGVLFFPFRWLFRKTLKRPLEFVALSLVTFLGWLILDVMWAGLKAAPRAIAATSRGAWEQVKSLIHSGLAQGGMTDEFELELGPSRLGLHRLTTVVVTASVVLMVGYLTSPGDKPAALVAYQQSGGDTGIRTEVVEATSTRMIQPKATAAVTPTAAKPIQTPTASAVTPTVENLLVEQAADPWPTPDPLGKGGSVVFTRRDNGNGDIYVLTIGRSKPIRLTNHPADDRDPAWSPNGRRIAFTSNRDGNWEIYVLDLETGDLSRLTHDSAFDGGPDWSPDGQWLVYESYQAGNLDLFIVATNGDSQSVRLTEHPAHDFSPDWSPDGRHVAFISWRSGNKDIYILNLDSISDDGAINVTSSPNVGENHPAFSPDGSRLAYYDDSAGFDLVSVLPLEEYQTVGQTFSIGQGRHPSWSADGSSLVFVHNGVENSTIVASSVDAWSVAPQAYTDQSDLDDLDWSSVLLPRDFTDRSNGWGSTQEKPLFVEGVDEPDDDVYYFLLKEILVDAPSPYLSDRVDDSFMTLRRQVLDEVGWDFLGRVDNMFSFLATQPLPGETEKSWNKAARAFDFYYRYPISDDPQVEIVREDQGVQTYWRVYLRTAMQDGGQGEPLRQLPWDFTARYGAEPLYYDQGGKLKEEIPSGYYVDFTALAADYGWTRVPALENWRTFFQGIRYWHFENRQGLTWDEAILELYTIIELERVFGER